MSHSAPISWVTESIVDGVVTEPDEIRDSLAVVLDESSFKIVLSTSY